MIIDAADDDNPACRATSASVTRFLVTAACLILSRSPQYEAGHGLTIYAPA
jgi:hypothetical protein